MYIQENILPNNKNSRQRTIWAITISLVIPLFIMILPLSTLGITTITVSQQRMLAIFVMAALLWVTEPVPTFTTSLLVIFLQLIFISDYSLVWFRPSSNVGQLLSYQSIFSSFSSPIVLLFIGGFSLAQAIKKYQIDYVIARKLLAPFGDKPKNVLLGLMLITALLSMFMSNTATTAMMISILVPVLRALPKERDNIRTAFALGIPFAANIGGIGTPIGTPPNAIALRTLPTEYAFSFAQWTAIATPFVIVLLLISWVILRMIYPTKVASIKISVPHDIARDRRRKIVYVTFFITVLLWMTDTIHGLNSYIVAMLPMVVFFISGVLTKQDLADFNWDVLWLVAGGIAIGYGVQQTELAQLIVTNIPFDAVSVTAIIIISIGITYLLSNFMSHTAAANLFFPLIVAVALSNSEIVRLGLVHLIVMCNVFVASLSMILPISTPPNALGYATGFIRTNAMIFLGLLIGLIGIGLSYGYLQILSNIEILK